MGLKESGLRGSLRNVSVGIDAIPDETLYRHNGSETETVDGETVDPWPDIVGDVDLAAFNSPTLQEGSLNGTDAVLTDGIDDGLEYAPNLASDVTEPLTKIFALSVESEPDGENIWRDNVGGNNEIQITSDDYRLLIDGNSDLGGSPVVGDQIVTLAVDNSEAILRVNGSQIASVESSEDVVIMSASERGAYAADIRNDIQYLNASWSEIITIDGRLSGDDLTSEEQRLEDEANMDVLS